VLVAIPALVLLSIVAVRSFATILPGGGPLPDGDSVRTDCYVYAELVGTLAVRQDKYIDCTDGDPTCDRDRTCNNSCRFRARICTHEPGASHCTAPHSLDSLHVNRRCPLEVPGSLTGSVCGAFVDFDVPLKQGGGKPHPARVRCMSRGKAPAGVKPRTDRDVFVFTCLPRTPPCP
jgi:hypothetical protein